MTPEQKLKSVNIEDKGIKTIIIYERSVQIFNFPEQHFIKEILSTFQILNDEIVLFFGWRIDIIDNTSTERFVSIDISRELHLGLGNRKVGISRCFSTFFKLRNL